MIRSLAVTLLALLIMGGLAGSAQADSTAVSGTVTGTTTTTATSNPAVFDLSFTGSGINVVDMVSGPFTTTSSSILTLTGMTTFTDSGGTFMDVFPGGTTFGTFSGTGTLTAMGSDFTVLVLTTGGTGAFAGDTGETTETGMTTTAGVTTATYTGFITTTPEPSSLALMLAGIGLLPLMRKRLARGQQPT